ncbi:MAG: SpoIID/LytB domain-containing protein [candidate division Zixibacteria bacterium]|nr:SpoIID/LytB domain-containing protein [candidate division Zixibacteria bacterium]
MFKQIFAQTRNRREKSGRAWQNLPVLIVLLIISLGLLSPLYGFSKKKPAKKFEFDRQIRVWLGARDNLELHSSGEMIIECYRTGDRAEIYYTSSKINVSSDKSGVSIKDNNGTLAMGLSSVVFRPRFPTVYLDYDEKRYRGNIECDANGDSGSQVRVFNLIDIESYLKGVLPGEIGERTEAEYESVKAQAIAARTYAIWRLSTQKQDKHLKNSIADQVYLGAGAELPLLSKGVEETEGLTMTSEGQPIAAYYHAVCGGSTAPIEKIWDGDKQSHLKGIIDGNYCQWAKTFFWNEEFTATQLKDNLSGYFGNKGELPKKGFGKIVSIKFEKDHSIGRMAEMKVKTTTDEFKVTSDQIRWALKRPSRPGSILPSTRFNASLRTSKGAITGLELVGAGNGHGIGMCQCGAIGRARDKADYKTILEIYYHKIDIEKIY